MVEGQNPADSEAVKTKIESGEVKVPEKKRQRRQKKNAEQKPVEEKPVEKPVFPSKAYVNPWGFVHLSRNVVEAFGVAQSGDEKKPYVKTELTVDFKDGALVIRKI